MSIRTKVALASLLAVALLLVGGGGVLYASDAARRARASVPRPHVAPSLDLAIAMGPSPTPVTPEVGSPGLAASPPAAGASGASGSGAQASTTEFGVPGLFELNDEVDKTRGYDLSQGVEPGEVLLTFDDGPNPESTPRILDGLARRRWKAIFFTVGWRYDPARAGGAEGQALLRRIAEAGHTIGNHSMTHPHLSALAPARARWEIDRNAELIELATGRTTTLFRPPFGDLPRAAIDRVRERRNALVMWTLDVRDWASGNPTEIADESIRLLRRHRRGIVLLHDSRPATAASTEQLFTWLEREEREGRIRVLDPETYLRKLVDARGVIREPMSNVAGSRLGRRAAPDPTAGPRPTEEGAATPPSAGTSAAAAPAGEPPSTTAPSASQPAASATPPTSRAPSRAAPRPSPATRPEPPTDPEGLNPPGDDAPESEIQDIEVGASAPGGEE
ncbi:MAG: polysaccharide deacetylase family protein [Deltaproteobacteria bacterium]|nr:polysaccharide deacetylase family protein [Deltaproteobacteria bacterium]